MLPWREDIFPSLPDRLECRDPLDWSSLAESWKRNITDLYIHIKYMYKFTKRHIRYISFLLLYRNCKPMKLNRGFKTQWAHILHQSLFYYRHVRLTQKSACLILWPQNHDLQSQVTWNLQNPWSLMITHNVLLQYINYSFRKIWSGHNYFLWEDRHSIITMLSI